MTQSILVFVVLFAHGWSHLPTPAVKPESLETLKKIDQKYLSAKTVIMKVNKTDLLSALDQKKTSSGEIRLQKGKFRLELESEDEDKEKTLIVVDGANLWQVQLPSEKVKGSKTQVAKMELKSKKKKPHELLAVLTEAGVLKYFTTNKSTETGEQILFLLTPRKNNKDMQKMEMVVNSKENVITQIKYSDALNNETTYQFSQVKFDQPLSDDLFKYVPPKGVEVMTY